MQCDICGKEGKLDSHHLIPIWCGGTDEDIIEVHRGCHTRVENMFKNFIFYGTFEKPRSYYNNEKRKEWKRKDYNNKKDQINKNIREDRKINPEKYRKQQKEWRDNHKDHISKRMALWRVKTGATIKSKIVEEMND